MKTDEKAVRAALELRLQGTEFEVERMLGFYEDDSSRWSGVVDARVHRHRDSRRGCAEARVRVAVGGRTTSASRRRRPRAAPRSRRSTPRPPPPPWSSSSAR